MKGTLQALYFPTRLFVTRSSFPCRVRLIRVSQVKGSVHFSGKTPSQEKDPRGRVAIRHAFMALVLDQRLKETRDYVDAIIHPRLMH